MRKIKLIAILILTLCLFVGCKKELPTISAANTIENTLLIRRDGSVQSAVVEDFDKDYYDKEELRVFIDDAVAKFNDSHGDKSVIVDSLEVSDGVASVVFTYASMEIYATFNDVEASYMTAHEAFTSGLMPETFSDMKDGEEILAEDALSHENDKVLVLNEEQNVIVDGQIKYYSNVILLNHSSATSAKDGTSIIIFRP